MPYNIPRPVFGIGEGVLGFGGEFGVVAVAEAFGFGAPEPLGVGGGWGADSSHSFRVKAQKLFTFKQKSNVHLI